MQGLQWLVLFLPNLIYFSSSEQAPNPAVHPLLNDFNEEMIVKPGTDHAPLSYASVSSSLSESGIHVAKLRVQAQQEFDALLNQVSIMNKSLQNLKKDALNSLERGRDTWRSEFSATKRSMLQECRAVGGRLLTNFKNAELERGIIADALKDIAIDLEEDKIWSDAELKRPLGVFDKILDIVENNIGSITKHKKSSIDDSLPRT